MTSKSSSRRAFLLSTLIAMPAVRARRKVEREKSDEREPDRERLERLAVRYGSELGRLKLKRVGR